MKKTKKLLFIGLLVVSIFGLIRFQKLGSGAFFSWDSASLIEFAREQFLNGDLFSGSPSYNQALGGVSYPANFKLLPEYFLSWDGNNFNTTRFYLATASLFFLATYLLSFYSFPNSNAALLSGVSFTLIILPYASPPILTELFWWHATYCIPSIYMHSLLILCYILAAKSKSNKEIIYSTILLTVTCLWIFIAHTKAAIPLISSSFCYWSFIFLFAPKRGKVCLLAAASFCVFILFSLGILDHTKAIFDSSATSLSLGGFGGKQINPLEKLFRISLLGRMQNNGIEPLIDLYLSMLPAIKYWSGYTFPIISMLSAVGVIIMNHDSKTNLINQIALGYIFSWLSFPFCAYGANNVLSSFNIGFFLLCAFWLMLWQRKPLVGFMVAFFGVSIFIMLSPMNPPGGYNIQEETSFVSKLKNEVGFGDGEKFRGRVFCLDDAAALESKDPTATSHSNKTLAALFTELSGRNTTKYKNDLCFFGLRKYSIPSIYEYNRMVTPVLALWYTTFLVEEGRPERIDYRVPNKINIPILKLMGVNRFISTNTNQIPPEFKLIQKYESGDGPLFLFGLEEVNLGTYSPTEVIIENRFSEIVKIINEKKDRLDKIAILEANITQPLVKADHVTISRIKNGIHVKAFSHGNSLLCLPFEYSDCYQMTGVVSNTTPKLQRVNGVFMGLAFNKSIETNICFKDRPWDRGLGRKKDIQWFHQAQLAGYWEEKKNSIKSLYQYVGFE